jgi:hypothetical protein
VIEMLTALLLTFQLGEKLLRVAADLDGCLGADMLCVRARKAAYGARHRAHTAAHNEFNLLTKSRA